MQTKPVIMIIIMSEVYKWSFYFSYLSLISLKMVAFGSFNPSVQYRNLNSRLSDFRDGTTDILK